MIPRVFGMVSTRHSVEYTRVALESFASTTPIRESDTFLLVDNDHSLPVGGWLPPFCAVTTPSAPRGFAENFNALIDQALVRNADLYLLNNDLVFTPGWSEPLEVPAPVILSPLSNREVQYANSVVVPKTGHVLNLTVFSPQFSLAEYVGHEAAFAAVIEAHRQSCSGYFPVYVAPFFCAKVPIEVLRTVGYLDASYGRGGGEDFDYCLRAHLAGYPVAYAVNSFVLHFGGKSSWSGAESTEQQHQRESQFREVFRAKWGEQLFELILRENSSVLDATQGATELHRVGNLAETIRVLLGAQPAPANLVPNPPLPLNLTAKPSEFY